MAAFEKNFAAIRAELEAFLAQQQVTFATTSDRSCTRAPTPATGTCCTSITAGTAGRSTAQFPTLMGLVDAIPRRSGTVFVSRLTPGTHIPAHCGATNTQLTCHFGVIVPAASRCAWRTRRASNRRAAASCSTIRSSTRSGTSRQQPLQRLHAVLAPGSHRRGDRRHQADGTAAPHPVVITRYLEGASALAAVRN